MNGITSDIDLKKLAQQVKIKLNGIYYKDELPLIPIEGNYIVNMASSNDNNGGTHWVGFILTYENYMKKVIYFDSFGIAEPILLNKFFLKWTNNNHNNIIRNNHDIQNLNSNYCGEYVIYFLHSILSQSKKISLEQRLFNFLNEFRNYNSNEI